jgi:hypothetical protein
MSPASSASKMRAKGKMGTTTGTARGCIRRSTSQAVVVSPGIPTRRPASSPSVIGARDTTTGPKPRPTEAPWGKSR